MEEMMRPSTQEVCITTEYVCAMCFFSSDIVWREDLIEKRDDGGKNSLPLHIYWYITNIPLHTLRGSSNVQCPAKEAAD